MAHMQTTGIESESPRIPIEVPAEPISEISATLLRAQAFLSGCGIALLVREGAWLVSRASNGAAAPDIGARVPVEQSFLGLCVTLKKPQSCEDTDSDLRVENANYSRLRPKSIVAVPVRAGQDVIAVLAGFSAAPNAFTNTQVAILRTVGDSLSRPVQQLPATPPPPEPPAPRVEPAPEPPRERAAKPEPPAPAPPAPAPVPAPREEVLTLADEVAAPPRTLEIRPPEPRPATPAMRVPSYPVPRSFEMARPRPSRFRPALFRISAITVVCLVCAFATAGWYSSRRFAVPHASAVPAAPVVNPAPVLAAAPAAPVKESLTMALEPAAPAPKPRAVEPARPGPEAVKEPVAEAPVQVMPAPKLPQAAPAAVEAPALALSASAAMPALVAPHAAAPRIHHSDATPARLEYRVPPQYPLAAMKSRITGEVVLSLQVHKDGSVGEVKMASGNPLFRDSAVDAVRKWRYAPATLEGEAVEATAKVVLKFDLPSERR